MNCAIQVSIKRSLKTVYNRHFYRQFCLQDRQNTRYFVFTFYCKLLKMFRIKFNTLRLITGLYRLSVNRESYLSDFITVLFLVQVIRRRQSFVFVYLIYSAYNNFRCKNVQLIESYCRQMQISLLLLQANANLFDLMLRQIRLLNEKLFLFFIVKPFYGPPTYFV